MINKQCGARNMLCVFALLLGTAHANATTVLLSNLSSPNGSSNSLSTNLTNVINVVLPSSYLLDDLTVSMSGTSMVPLARILSDSSGTPGSVLATLTPSVSTLTSTFQNVSFTGAFSFAPGQYWLEFAATGPNSAEIRTSSMAYAGVATSNQLGTRSGASYSFYGFTPSSDGIAMNLNGTAVVPLPAAAWLLLSGLGALGVVNRRRTTG